jgi:hypothetical protein
VGTGFSTVWEPARWRQLEAQHGSGTWFAAELGRLCVACACSLQLSIFNLSVDWQSNIYLDKVQVLPAELHASC